MTATTATALGVVHDQQRAKHAREKARRALPPRIAHVVVDAIEDLRRFPNLVDRARWTGLVDDVMTLPEPAGGDR